MDYGECKRQQANSSCCSRGNASGERKEHVQPETAKRDQNAEHEERERKMMKIG
jgi:hypothetical protein